MIQFSRLRVQGFKSFVDKTEFEIGPGLTGIVGPNGCGKSNIVDALRWSMGENSSKRMRGGTGTMDDVIFNGTEARPSRNMAEVSILLDNSKRTAPAPWNTGDEIEIVRKIERDHGSSYRINGKNVRARDVQLLYADLTSGAGSPFLVSQGKVTNLIQAKPVERRAIIEEAAGITGLYARRHEAELRLLATDQNLARLEDIVDGMEARLGALRKQSRQAVKYRTLSAEIRQLEIQIASLDYRRAFDSLRAVEREFDTVEAQVAERMITVSQLTQTQGVQAQDIPGLRQRDAEMGAGLQAQRLALQRLDDEAQRLANQLQDARNQQDQIGRDRAHEAQTLAENNTIIEALTAEEARLNDQRQNGDQILQWQEADKAARESAVAERETVFTGLMEKLAADRARRQSLDNQAAHDRRRRDAVAQRLQQVSEQLDGKRRQEGGDVAVDALREELTRLDGAIEARRSEITELTAGLEAARAAREQARQAQREAEGERAKLESEIRTLESVVKIYAGEGFRPVFEDVRADKGFEIALSRALGDTLMASLDSNAPVAWQRREVPDLPPLPAGVSPLKPHVRAPDALHLALSQIGVVEAVADGAAAAAALRPGQSLVSRDGAYWRWDGLHINVTASDRHAAQLQQKNRLDEVSARLPAAMDNVQALAARSVDAERTQAALQTRFGELQQAQSSDEAGLRNKRQILDRTMQAQGQRVAELARLEEAIAQATADLATLDESLEANMQTLAAFDDASLAEQQLKTDTARSGLAATRLALNEAIRDLEISRQEAGRRNARLQAIGDERVNLSNRCIRARDRITELGQRDAEQAARIDSLRVRPGEIRAQRETLLSRITEQEQEKSAIADRLAALEGELVDTTKALKEAESLLSAAREGRAHAQATAAERGRQLHDIQTYIQEQFGMTPEALAAQAQLPQPSDRHPREGGDPEAQADIEPMALDPRLCGNDEMEETLDAIKSRKDKAVRDRDLIGPVNLQAEAEATGVEQQLTGVMAERNDLIEAVSELRGGINTLNKEARERLQTAFARVNEHFRDMFTRLFIGGKAHLALIESDDPLEAGLEIFAQPPGKALQSLSLLSGGEQTLTAVALIFAIFLTNPAPICVLDEVDAPLDDANVDRFCDMLDEFADRGETRFLVVTHHRLTMARMDRLYGVTMAERGVSQLVSVDMNQQFEFLEAAE